MDEKYPIEPVKCVAEITDETFSSEPVMFSKKAEEPVIEGAII